MADLAQMTHHAEQMVRRAARVAMGHFRGGAAQLGIEFKADDSPVTVADRAVESELRAYLAALFPAHGIYGEEQGMAAGNSAHLWVIDPIDGTRSFLSGHPLFGVLLAHLYDGKPDLGVIGMPALDEVLIGVSGQGATLNGAPIATSDQTDLDRAILYVNEADKIYRDRAELFARLMASGQTRRLGHDCYPHALVAMGHADAVVDYDLQPYDYLALSAVIEAAGGVMTDWDGAPLSLKSDGRVISAATPELHRQILKLTRD